MKQNDPRLSPAVRAWLQDNPPPRQARDCRIVALRRAGLKQAAIAARVGLTQTRVSQILRRAALPKETT